MIEKILNNKELFEEESRRNKISEESRIVKLSSEHLYLSSKATNEKSIKILFYDGNVVNEKTEPGRNKFVVHEKNILH